MYLHDNIALFYNFLQESCATINSGHHAHNLIYDSLLNDTKKKNMEYDILIKHLHFMFVKLADALIQSTLTNEEYNKQSS